MRKLKNIELNRPSVEEFRQAEKIPVVIVLDNVRSMHNVGSVFRTADAFSCQSIYLCGITASPPHREIEKTALGATESVEWKYSKSTSEVLKELKKNGFEIIGVEQIEGGEFLNLFQPVKEKKYAVVFGHEMSGISEEVISMMDIAIEVPQAGTKHSLNISVCAGIVMWELFKHLRPDR